MNVDAMEILTTKEVTDMVRTALEQSNGDADQFAERLIALAYARGHNAKDGQTA